MNLSHHFPCEYSLIVMALHLFVRGIDEQLFDAVHRETLETEQIEHAYRVLVAAENVTRHERTLKNEREIEILKGGKY